MTIPTACRGLNYQAAYEYDTHLGYSFAEITSLHVVRRRPKVLPQTLVANRLHMNSVSLSHMRCFHNDFRVCRMRMDGARNLGGRNLHKLRKADFR